MAGTIVATQTPCHGLRCVTADYGTECSRNSHCDRTRSIRWLNSMITPNPNHPGAVTRLTGGERLCGWREPSPFSANIAGRRRGRVRPGSFRVSQISDSVMKNASGAPTAEKYFCGPAASRCFDDSRQPSGLTTDDQFATRGVASCLHLAGPHRQARD